MARSLASSAASAHAATVSASRHASSGAAPSRAFSVPGSTRSTAALRSLLNSFTGGSSYRTIRLWFLAREQMAEVERPGIFGRRREALSDLRLAQSMIDAELTLDIVSQRPSRPGELPRYRRFVLANQPPDLGEGQLLNIVATEPKAASAVEPIDGPRERLAEERQMLRTIGIRRVGGAASRGDGGAVLRHWLEPFLC